MAVPGYTDISHFRAPYKNSYLYTGVGGFGVVATSPPAAPPVAPTAEQAMLAATVTESDGLHWRPEAVDMLMPLLDGSSAVFMSPHAVQVEALTQEQMTALRDNDQLRKSMEKAGVLARSWIDQRLAQGHVVFATFGVAFPQVGARQLAAVPASNKDLVRATSMTAPILATPGLMSMLRSPVAIGAFALVAGVAGWAIYAGMKKRRRRV